jgi:hypothetical protein
MHLDALTIKSMYAVLIIDELLDELLGESWFSKLDLRAGYYQIRVAPWKNLKLHFKHTMVIFEFTVMDFGLTSAPTTFISAMNDTLKEYLRKVCPYFFDDITMYTSTYEEHLYPLSFRGCKITMGK